MFILNKRLIFSSLICFALSQFAVQNAKAQSHAAGVFGLIGGMIAAAQMQAAKEAWAAQPETRLYCAQKALARHNVTIAALIQNGVMPSDARLAPIGSECSKFEPGGLKSNYRCNVLDGNGGTASSTCNQAFGQTDNTGNTQAIDVRTAIDLYFSNGSLQLVDVETDAGRQERYRQAERQRQIAELTELRRKVENLMALRSESLQAEGQTIIKRIAGAVSPKSSPSGAELDSIQRDYKALAKFADAERARLTALEGLSSAKAGAEQKASGDNPQDIKDAFDTLQAQCAALTQEPAPVFVIDRTEQDIGPTYDCAKAKDPLGKIICSDKGLRRLDVDLLRPYYVLRFSAPDQRNTLKQEAVAFTQSVLQTCSIPEKGAIAGAAMKKAVSCVGNEYRRQRDLWRAQMEQAAPVAARDEIGRTLDEHVRLQKLLQELGFIPASEKADGIYGAATRTAISNLQTAEGITADGLLSDETARRLLQRGSPSMAGGADASANAEDQATRLADLAKSYNDLSVRIDRYRAERAREQQLIAVLTEAETYISEKISLPLPTKAMAALSGLKDEIVHVRASSNMVSLENTAATFKKVKASTDEAVSVLNATTDKNRFLVEGASSDILVLYNDSGKAPSLVKNLKGDLVFAGNKPSICQRHDGVPESNKARLLNARFSQYSQSFAFPLPRCDVGNLKAYDVIVAVRQALASEKSADLVTLLSSVDAGTFKMMFSITDRDVDAALQAEAALLQDIQKRIDAGAVSGFGLVAMKGGSGDLCLIVGTDLDAHQLLLQPYKDRLLEDLKLSTITTKGASVEDAFIAAKRGECAAVYGAAADLKSLVGALGRDQVAFHHFPIWVEPEQVAKAREQALAIAKEKAEAEARRKAAVAFGERIAREKPDDYILVLTDAQWKGDFCYYETKEVAEKALETLRPALERQYPGNDPRGLLEAKDLSSLSYSGTCSGALVPARDFSNVKSVFGRVVEQTFPADQVEKLQGSSDTFKCDEEKLAGMVCYSYVAAAGGRTDVSDHTNKQAERGLKSCANPEIKKKITLKGIDASIAVLKSIFSQKISDPDKVLTECFSEVMRGPAEPKPSSTTSNQGSDVKPSRQPSPKANSMAAKIQHQGYAGDPEAKNCAAYIERMYNSIRADRYDSSKVHEEAVEITFYGVNRIDGVFGGRKYESFVALQYVYEDQQVRDVHDVSEKYCVLDDNNRVLGLENDMQ